MSKPVDFLKQLDEFCDEFESAWQSAKPIKIETFLQRADKTFRAKLLGEMLALELEYRSEHDAEIEKSDYIERFPQYAEIVEAAFQESQHAHSSLSIQGQDTLPYRSGSKGSLPLVSDRYRNLEHFAAGGLGQVFTADDIEFDRTVAIKQIHKGYASNSDNQSRFIREAEITGRLQHPGIVSVYSIGNDEAGRPFYAMRLIEGETMLEAIDAFHKNCSSTDSDLGNRRIVWQQLLNRFVDVCFTIEYAHSMGVAHRDLKPANILVGAFGETQIIDWGMAKFHDEADSNDETLPTPFKVDETVQGAVFGTPGYMSPEQAAGDVEVIGKTSDIYSLGATLYQLLTGQLAFEADTPIRMLEQIRQNNFVPPRLRNRRVSKALEAICLKAMSARPVDRYPSAAALARDIERYLADDPVEARRDRPWERAARWARRHRKTVSGIVASSAALLVSLSIALGFVGQAKKRESEARVRETQQKERAVVRGQESKQYYRMARKAVDRLLAQIADEELLKTAAFEHFRRDLLLAAKAFYSRLVEAKPEDPELWQDVTRSHRQLATIHSDLGDRNEAIRELNLAKKALTEKAGTQETGNIAAEMAVIENLLATEYKNLTDYQKAEEHYVTAIKNGRNAIKQSESPEYELQMVMATLLNDAGAFYGTSANQYEQAVKYYEESLSLLEQVPETFGRRDSLLAQITLNLSLVHAQQGDRKKTIELLESVEPNVAKSLLSNPKDRRLLELSARIHHNLGNYCLDSKKCVKHLQAAQQDYRELYEQYPDVVRFRAKWGLVNANLARRYRDMGEVKKAMEAVEPAIKTGDLLVKEAPEDRMNIRIQALAHSEMGFLLMLRSKPEEAEQHFESAIGQFKKLLQQDALGVIELGVFANGLNVVCQSALNRREIDGALEDNAIALKISEQLYEEYDEEPFHINLFAYSHMIEFFGRRAKQETEAAKSSAETSLKLFRELRDKFPGYQKQTIDGYIKLLEAYGGS